MHSHQLHQDVVVACECCRLNQPFRLTSKHDQVICKACVRHVGNSSQKTEQRNSDHLGLWLSELTLLIDVRDGLRSRLSREQAAARQEQLRMQGEIDQLTEAITQGLSDASPADVRQLMTQQVVRDAEEARDTAYRSRDRVYQLLWRLDEKHRPDEREQSCVCGQRPCSVLDVIGDDDRQDLYAWERRNVDRSKKGYPHGLPRDHPDYRDWRSPN